MFTYPNVWVMVAARFLMGFFYDATHSVSIWSMYEILLPRHRERALTLFYVFTGLSYFSTALLGVYDNGGRYFWRISFLVPCLVVIVEVLLSFVIFPKVNTLTFLVKTKGEEEALRTLNYYFEERTAKFLVQEFQKNQISENRERFIGVKEDERNSSELVDLHLQADLSKNQNAKNTFQNENKSGENSQIGGFLTDFKLYRTEAVHIILFTVASMLSFHDTYYLFAVYYGSKNLTNKAAVSKSKHFILFGSVTKILSCFVVGVLNWTKKRKLCLLACHLATLVLLTAIAYAFYIEDLTIARYCLVIFPLFTVGIFSVNDIYSNDVCPPSLYTINHMLVRGLSAVFGLLIPLYIHFEILSYQGVALRLFSLVFVGVVCFGWLSFFMIETDGLNKIAIRKRLKGE